MPPASRIARTLALPLADFYADCSGRVASLSQLAARSRRRMGTEPRLTVLPAFSPQRPPSGSGVPQAPGRA